MWTDDQLLLPGVTSHPYWYCIQLNVILYDYNMRWLGADLNKQMLFVIYSSTYRKVRKLKHTRPNHREQRMGCSKHLAFLQIHILACGIFKQLLKKLSDKRHDDVSCHVVGVGQV